MGIFIVFSLSVFSSCLSVILNSFQKNILLNQNLLREVAGSFFISFLNLPQNTSVQCRQDCKLQVPTPTYKYS